MGSIGSTYEIPPYERPPPTKEDLDWAPLVTIDVSHFDEPGEKQRLAAHLEDTIRNVGFWIVTGHGIPDEEVKRMLAIGNAFFKLPMEEKVKVPIDLGNDLNWGYREPTRALGESGWKESVETYELHKDIPALQDVKDSDLIKAYKSEWAPFMKKMYERIARPLYILIAIIMELPEDYFTSRIEWQKRSECWLRFMLHPPRPDDYYEASRKFGISGHSDQSSITMLWPQNVAALQMLTQEGKWKWVKPVPGGVTINAGELMSHVTKGYVKATVHRVYTPPKDQRDCDRLGLIYFSLFNDDTKILPAPSPKLLRLGLITEEEMERGKNPPPGTPTSVEYTRSRMRSRHHITEFKQRDENHSYVYKGLEAKSNYD